ncbi:MAG: hypothetical protein OXE85_08965, partial [Roseovarius sp.]|nr:hypothetical protein [Roseovarius sp.]
VPAAASYEERNLYLWDDLGSLVRRFTFPDRETLYRGLAGNPGGEDHIGPVQRTVDATAWPSPMCTSNPKIVPCWQNG